MSLADDLAAEKPDDPADKLRSELSEMRKRLDTAHELIERQQSQLERRVKPRVRLPVNRTYRSFFRVIVPDTHGCYCDRAAFSALLGDLPFLRPRELVLLGDHLDCSGFLAEHHPLSYTQQSYYSFEEDCDQANAHLDALAERVPDECRIDYLEGNHERRVEAWVLKQRLRHERDAHAMLRAYSPRFKLHLERRGISYFGVGDFHDGLRTRGTIKRGKCYFVHGFSHAQNATKVHLQKIGACVVHGHTHRVSSASVSPVEQGNIQAWCPGTLSELVPLYLHGRPADWSHGYGVQLVDADTEDFLHVQVPIIDGKSYLAPLVEHLRN